MPSVMTVSTKGSCLFVRDFLDNKAIITLVDEGKQGHESGIVLLTEGALNNEGKN